MDRPITWLNPWRDTTIPHTRNLAPPGVLLSPSSLPLPFRLHETVARIFSSSRFALSLGVPFASSLPAADAAPQRILFLGNSITKHGPKADIGWTGNWGMAASAEDKDYVNLVTKGIAALSTTPPQTLVQNIAEFERTYATYDLSTKLKAAVEFQPSSSSSPSAKTCPP